MGHRHKVRQVISTFAFCEGWSLDDAIKKVMHTTDYPKDAQRDVEGVYKILERDPDRYSVGCSDGNNRGIFINEDLLKSLCQRYGIKLDDGVLTV